MVQQITKFKTEDGQLFDNPQNAEAWEQQVNKANAIKSMFPNNQHLSSGDFYRLPMQLITDARHKLADALNGIYDDKVVKAFKDNTGNALGRYLDDGGSAFYGAWMLFECIDDQGRMFNQPFFAYNPEKAESEVPY